MDDTSDDDDDGRLSTINLTPSEAGTGATDEYGLSHDEDDDPPGKHDQLPQDDILLERF